jgi:hypothetical protein
MENETTTKTKKSIETGLPKKILTTKLIEEYDLEQGLENLKSLPSKPQSLPGKELYEVGLIGLRGTKLVLTCCTEPVQYMELGKFIALIERAHEEDRPSVILQNYTPTPETKGQISARLNLESSAITIIHGAGGRAIKSPKDVLWTYVYLVGKFDLMAYYLMAKVQLCNKGLLDEQINAFDGQCLFEVPLDLLKPTV